jgi:hypothetical protein
MVQKNTSAAIDIQLHTDSAANSMPGCTSTAFKQRQKADTGSAGACNFALETGSPSNVEVDGSILKETEAPEPTAKTSQPEQGRTGRPKRSHANVSYCEKRTKPRTARKLSDWFGFSGAAVVPVLRNGDCFYSAVVKAFESIKTDVQDLLVKNGVQHAHLSHKSGCQALRAICSDTVDDDIFLQFQACAHNSDFDFMKRFGIKNKGDLQRKMLDCGSDYTSSQKGAEKSIWACEFEMGALRILFID